MPSLFVARDGSESVSTTVLIPKPLKDAARKMGISLSGTLSDALRTKIENLERAEFDRKPAAGTPTTATDRRRSNDDLGD